jgi:hypothetical protein
VNAAHRTFADFGVRLSFKGKVWAVAVLSSLAVWTVAIWVGLQILS